jgi:hypothetical protein
MIIDYYIGFLLLVFITEFVSIVNSFYWHPYYFFILIRKFIIYKNALLLKSDNIIILKSEKNI